MLTRPRFESVTRTLNRLLKFVKKSKSPKKTEPLIKTRRSNEAPRTREDVVSCEIELQYPDESNVEMSTFQNDHIVSGIFFTLDSTTFTFLRDPPVTRSMQLFPKAVVLMGYPLVLTISSEFADGVDCDWYSCLDDEEMIHVGKGETFYPTEICVGRRLKAVCTPWCWEIDMTNDVDVNATRNGFDHGNSEGNNVKVVESRERTGANDDAETSATQNNTVDNRNIAESQQKSNRKRTLGRPAVCYSAKKVFQPVSRSDILEVRKDFIELRRAGKEVVVLGNSAGKATDEDGYGLKSLNKFQNENKKFCSNTDVRSSNLLINSTVSNNSNTVANNNHSDSNDNVHGSKDIRGEKELRVMTFNTLAEPFAISNHAINNIYSYCHIDHLDTEYRAQLTGLELLSYDADVLCLQECDSKTFKSYYYPLLSDKGYDLHYTNKVCKYTNSLYLRQFLNTLFLRILINYCHHFCYHHSYYYYHYLIVIFTFVIIIIIIVFIIILIICIIYFIASTSSHNKVIFTHLRYYTGCIFKFSKL